MLYLVDGYNVTKADPATRSLSLEGQRDALVSRLRVRGQQLLGVGRVVVVFDGQEGEGLSFESATPVEVRFSREDSADDVIVRLAGASTEAVCVVSSDSDLGRRVREYVRGRTKIEVRGREALFESRRGVGRQSKGNRYPAASAGIPRGGNRITEELKAIWLTDDAAGEDEE